MMMRDCGGGGSCGSHAACQRPFAGLVGDDMARRQHGAVGLQGLTVGQFQRDSGGGVGQLGDVLEDAVQAGVGLPFGKQFAQIGAVGGAADEALIADGGVLVALQPAVKVVRIIGESRSYCGRGCSRDARGPPCYRRYQCPSRPSARSA